jgi:hypothetical protein
MNLKIPYNIFIFIWSLIGIVVLIYGLSNDFISNRFANVSRLELIFDVNFLLLFSLYAIKYLKHRKETKKLL